MEKVIENIKSRIDTMVNCCSAIRTLNGCIANLDGCLVVSLNDLKPSWEEVDRRPELSYGKAGYIDFKKYRVFATNGADKELVEEMKERDLEVLNDYLELMIPRPLSESAKI